MYKKIKLVLAVAVFTFIAFSCEKANVEPEKNDKTLTETNEKAGNFTPLVTAYYEPICTGPRPEMAATENTYNTLKVIYGDLHHHRDFPFVARVYDTSNDQLVKTVIGSKYSAINYIVGLANDKEYQVVITTSKGQTTADVGEYEIWPESVATTLSCIPNE
jgi:hypothetical protein